MLIHNKHDLLRTAAERWKTRRTALAPSRKTISSADRMSATSSWSLPPLQDTLDSLPAWASFLLPAPAGHRRPSPSTRKPLRTIRREQVFHLFGRSRKRIRCQSPVKSVSYPYHSPSPALASRRNHAHRAA